MKLQITLKLISRFFRPTVLQLHDLATWRLVNNTFYQEQHETFKQLPETLTSNLNLIEIKNFHSDYFVL